MKRIVLISLLINGLSILNGAEQFTKEEAKHYARLEKEEANQGIIVNPNEDILRFNFSALSAEFSLVNQANERRHNRNWLDNGSDDDLDDNSHEDYEINKRRNVISFTSPNRVVANEHIRTKMICDFCCYQTLSLRSLQKHLQKHSQKHRILFFRCDYGNCRFKTNNNEDFSLHVRYHYFEKHTKAALRELRTSGQKLEPDQKADEQDDQEGGESKIFVKKLQLDQHVDREEDNSQELENEQLQEGLHYLGDLGLFLPDVDELERADKDEQQEYGLLDLHDLGLVLLDSDQCEEESVTT